ncbi:MAG: hypothetical protein ACR2M4_03565 [Actinomycetota bacterium]
MPATPAEDCGQAPAQRKTSCYEKALDKLLAGQGTEAALDRCHRLG